MAKPHHLTDAEFQSVVIESQIPVVIDFWAAWCGPCRMIAPIIDEMANEFEGKALITKIDVDNNPGVASKYGIRSIPTVLIFKNGEVVDQIIGAVPKSQIVERLQAHL
ncbi:thioredoxin [Candidatus Kapaibacterium sp.]